MGLVVMFWRLGVVGAFCLLGLMAETAFDSAQAAINRGVSGVEFPISELEVGREWMAQGAEGSEAEQLFNEGFALLQEGTAESLQAALEKFEAAIPLYQAENNVFGEASMRLAQGSILAELGFNSEALASYEKSLVIWQELAQQTTGENLQVVQQAKATTFNNIAGVYDALGEKQRALRLYNQALPLLQALGNRGGEATTLNNIGAVYDALGEKQRALRLYNQALPFYRAVSDRDGEATVLNNIGLVYDTLGEKQRALGFYNQALPFYRAVGDRDGEATVLNNIGRVYDALGEKQRALEFFNRTLPLLQALGNRGGEATILNNIGRVYDDLGEKQRALEFLNQALPFYRAVSDRDGEATVLNNIGLVHNALGEKQRALEFFNQALPLVRAVGERGREAVTLNNIGGVYLTLGEKQRALEFLNQALPLYRAVGDIEGEYTALGHVANLQRDQGQLNDALTNIQAAIALIEKLRSLTPPGELRQTYFATVQSYYQLHLDILMELHQQNPNQGYDAQAFAVSEQSRARTLIEQLTEANLDIRQGVDPQLLAQEQNLLAKLNAAEQQRINLLKTSYSNDQLEAVKTTINQTLQDLKDVESRIRQASPTYAQLKFPDPLTLAEVQDQILDDETLLLEYALGEEQSYLFLVSKTGLQTYTLPPQAEIEAAVEAYRDKLQDRTFTDLRQGQALSEMLLGQVAEKLGNKRLLVVSNGKLQLLPFGALPIPNNAVGAIPPWLPSGSGVGTGASQTGVGTGALPLLANHEIITLPSATSLAVQRRQWKNRPKASKTVAVIADPVFQANDDRFTGNRPNVTEQQDLAASLGLRTGCTDFSRLPYTATEAQEILDRVPDAQEFSAIGFDANHDIATNPDLGQYQILHLATHGCIQDDARLSGLALSFYDQEGDETENTSLKLQDIYNLELNAELVVLSACQTGIGENVAGEGVVGLTSGFLYAGAKRVVVSLWNVNDRATADLMSDYYRRMLEENRDPHQGLRQAQLAMWESQEFRAPFYWAAFTMQGEF